MADATLGGGSLTISGDVADHGPVGFLDATVFVWQPSNKRTPTFSARWPGVTRERFDSSTFDTPLGSRLGSPADARMRTR